MCERWVGDWTDCDIFTPPSYYNLSALLSHSAGLLNRGSWGPKPSARSWFSLPRTPTRTSTTTDCNQLELSVASSYIIFWHPPASRGRRNCTEFNPSMVKVISSTECTCFLIGGWVEGQYVTESLSWNYLTVCKEMCSGLFKNNITYKLFLYKILVVCVYIYIIKEYILDFIYFIPWKFVCDLRFHEVLQTTIIWQITKEKNYIALGSSQTHKVN